MASWWDAIIASTDVVAEAERPLCPSCNAERTRCQFIGDLATRIGYLAVWCPACLVGIRVSRVKAPEGADLLSFDAPASLVNEHVPAYREVQLPPRGQS